MRVTKIKIIGFKSIYDELELDFNTINGFWKIGGSVGAGKTTIGEAIIFGLFGSITGKSNDSLISWGKKHCIIELWCTSKNHNIYIRREINKYGQSPIYATIDGEELVFTNKRDGQSQLEQEYYDVSRTTLELLCIISFNNFKSLATLSAADTKKFLDQVLGFSILTQYSDACRELRKIPWNKGLELLRQIDSNNDQIKKIDELTNMARIEGDIKFVQSIISDFEKDRKQVNENWDALLATENEHLNNHQIHLAQIRTLGSNKKKEIDFIKKGTCPTCGAPIDQSQLSIKEQEREELLSRYNEVNRQLDEVKKSIHKLEDDKKKDDEMFKNKIIEQRNLLAQLKEQEKRSKINTSEIDKLKQQNIELQKQANTYSADDEQWLELQNILSDDVRAKILSSFIPALNKNILKYTQQLQIPYIINFNSSFKCSINIYGVDDPVPLSALSTGQLKTVDMCIIMGVLGTIMNNISFNIIFLDELFSNMDADLRSTMCQVLKQNMKLNQSLFVISHVDLESKYFDGQIDTKLQYIDEIHRKSIYTIIQNE